MNQHMTLKNLDELLKNVLPMKPKIMKINPEFLNRMIQEGIIIKESGESSIEQHMFGIKFELDSTIDTYQFEEVEDEDNSGEQIPQSPL